MENFSTESDLRYQVLTQVDVPAIAPLYQDVFNAAPWNDGWGLEAVIERLGLFAKYPQFFGLAIWKGGKLAGFALGWSERWVQDWQFHLYEMCIAREHQRTGLGRSLLAELERQLKEKNQSSIFLKTGASVPAREFYKSCGFVERGLVVLGKKLAGDKL